MTQLDEAHFELHSANKDKMVSLLTVFPSSYLSKFSNKTLRALGSLEIPFKPDFSASLRLKNL